MRNQAVQKRPKACHSKTGNMSDPKKIGKTDEEWRQQLSPTEYEGTRNAGGIGKCYCISSAALRFGKK